MSQTLEKRGREPEALSVSADVREAKRFHGEEDECAPSEDVVNGVMKSLEEEIGTTSFPFYPSSNSGYNSASSNICSGQEGETLASDSGVELLYLLEASDDELGIPLNPVLDCKDEIWQSPKETSDCLLENPDLKSLSEIWHFEDEVENYQQFAFYEDAYEASVLQDYLNRDFVSQDMFFDGDLSEAWTLETTGCL
jgi:hypothetical protein